LSSAQQQIPQGRKKDGRHNAPLTPESAIDWERHKWYESSNPHVMIKAQDTETPLVLITRLPPALELAR
jgi:hypothetical protein